MRDFEALRAEVYRRGEEKKTKIKRTRRTFVALCLPLALCVTAVCFLPQAAENSGGWEDALYAEENVNAGNSQMEAVMDIYETAAASSLVSSAVSVEVKGAEGWVWYSKDTQTILAVSEALHAITGIQQDAYTTVEDSKVTSAALAPGSFQITFTDREGSRIVYLLTEERLEVSADHLEFSVTPQQYAQLQSLLAP